MDWYFGQKWFGIKLKHFNDRLVFFYKHSFSLHKMLTDDLEWCGLLWCFYQLFAEVDSTGFTWVLYLSTHLEYLHFFLETYDFNFITFEEKKKFTFVTCLLRWQDEERGDEGE